MAGDWIKFETSTPDKPEVWQIAESANIDPDAVVGKLLRIWIWFDQHTETANAPSVSKLTLDRLVGVSGFCNFVISAGWMHEKNGEISLPHFDRHNGKTAKNRALTAKRVAKHTANAKLTQAALPKEEKRRDIKELPNGSSKNSRKRFQKPTHADLQQYATERGFTHFDPDAFLDHYESNGWKVGRNPMKSWQHAASKWERENAKRNEARGTGGKRSTAETVHDAYKHYAETDGGELDCRAVLQDAGSLRPQVVEFSPVRRIGESGDD